MAYPEPVMQQASTYTDALKQAATFAVAGERLTLSDKGGAALATFGEQSRTLGGTSWAVTGYNSRSIQGSTSSATCLSRASSHRSARSSAVLWPTLSAGRWLMGFADHEDEPLDH